VQQPYDGRVKNVTEEARETLRFLEVFQREEMPAQKEIFVSRSDFRKKQA
jgi:hypothetical protein